MISLSGCKRFWADRIKRDNGRMRINHSAHGLVILACVLFLSSRIEAFEIFLNTKEGWFPNPNQNQLFLAPTARLLKGGEAQFSNYSLFLIGAAIGITDNLTFGGGTLLTGLGRSNGLSYGTLKIGLIQRDIFNLALGAVVLNFGSPSNLNALYGAATFGAPPFSATLCLGYPFTQWQNLNMQVIMLGGEIRLLPWLAIVTENYGFWGADYGGPLGLRFIYEMGIVDIVPFYFSNGRIAAFPFPLFSLVFKPDLAGLSRQQNRLKPQNGLDKLLPLPYN